MIVAINYFVKEWSQHLKPNEWKNINLEAIKLGKEKQKLTFRKPVFFPSLLGNETQNCSSTHHLGIRGSF